MGHRVHVLVRVVERQNGTVHEVAFDVSAIAPRHYAADKVAVSFAQAAMSKRWEAGRRCEPFQRTDEAERGGKLQAHQTPA
ncbi:MAG TPA: hypothetical protein VNS12_15080 [Pelagibacterium sp.]|uniref:hypothetical protein n=1 Tax=Pelagibacterium sp. TaxID=1967288 RepID=UPI002B86FDF4|nr:hypothetical protein [Pelagibacterium sp.]HWJ89388.1 hypothetical protein [Pelagibacterium sp.]